MNMLGMDIEKAPGELVFFDFEGRSFEYEITGVVNDIHQFSLHQAIAPLMFSIDDGQRYQNIIIDANMEHFQSLISFLEEEWNKVVKETPFSYFILDDHLMKQYESDFNTFSLIKYFAIISIIISALGLYAISMFLAERRFKEIGIRKAFGAEIKNILILVSVNIDSASIPYFYSNFSICDE